MVGEQQPGARLRRVAADELTIRRVRRGTGFSYRDAAGRAIRDADMLARIRSLAVPPAYQDVRIAADPRAHLQAVGRDEAGRVQHRYHPAWERMRERRKLKRLIGILDALPKLRASVARDLRTRGLGRDKALACAVAIIDRCHIRVGNEAYATANGSFGASTLLKRHVELTRRRIALVFRGKSGVQVACAFEDAPLARALASIMTLPGRRLLQYRGEDGAVAPIRAGEVNAYLRRVSGCPVSSKDLRMLAANATAAEHLLASGSGAAPGDHKRELALVMREVSERLANTPAVVRKSYVHEIVVNAYASGRLKACYDGVRGRAGCSRTERALALLAAEAARR
ncbi:DNA topoisomerase IB [Bosea psychrotolerans]|uniref:DNA topoisomerase-1 n=1 Tax=Bosea psychrotolerans TaxID=1871628 RepID=A0A2S4MCX2_9HYPH|nr:DNA topoisomerase IB [Bosea psychrotolerans]POR52485.1 DNA topoisomerase-1 [Bosea psychrotolerans]